MDRQGVRRMVCMHTLPGDLDAAARGIAAAGGRLVGYAMVNPLAPGAAAAVERAARDHGFRGVALFPAMFGFRIDGEEAAAVLEVADRYALNAFVHCGVLKVGFRKKLGLPTGFDLSLSNPLNLSRPCARFPRVNFIVPHLGSGMFRELLMLADTFPNVYADTSGIGAWPRYLDGRPAQGRVLAQALDVLGEDRLLFGTDSTFFPRGWRRDVLDEHLRVFDQEKLPPDVVRKILGGNLARLLD
jgi:predicted TIM-barrel fold metal-dependent hydrolase